MSLGIQLNAALKAPLYQQLVEAITRRIDEGAFADGERLPSVRDLALEVRINPNTVARAYQELENKGLATSQRGKGVFIRLPGEGSPDMPVEVAKAMERLIDAARQASFPLDQLEPELRDFISLSSAMEK